jgi:hypothetical protein
MGVRQFEGILGTQRTNLRVGINMLYLGPKHVSADRHRSRRHKSGDECK